MSRARAACTRAAQLFIECSMTLSVCMIVKDEEEVLARCLKCVKPFADEIIVVDTGSSDSTAKIARSFTDKVYNFEWQDDFSAARNFSFSKAGCDLVMWLDADDVISAENAAKIAALKGEMVEYDVAFLLYAAAFDGERPTFMYYRERIFRRSANFVWQGAVHEVIEPCGRVLHSDACIWHKKIKPSQPMRNLRIYQRQLSEGKTLSPREKFYYGRELFYNTMYAECAAVLEDFLRGEGWAENRSEACITLYYAYTALNEPARAEASLLKSFSVNFPKSQACCILGERFLKVGDYSSAIFWYKTAAALPQNIESGAFVNADYSGFIPYMQLCVLYDRLGDYKTANSYNELAGGIKPNDAGYLHNRRYFEYKLK